MNTIKQLSYTFLDQINLLSHGTILIFPATYKYINSEPGRDQMNKMILFGIIFSHFALLTSSLVLPFSSFKNNLILSCTYIGGQCFYHQPKISQNRLNVLDSNRLDVFKGQSVGLGIDIHMIGYAGIGSKNRNPRDTLSSGNLSTTNTLQNKQQSLSPQNRSPGMQVIYIQNKQQQQSQTIYLNDILNKQQNTTSLGNPQPPPTPNSSTTINTPQEPIPPTPVILSPIINQSIITVHDGIIQPFNSLAPVNKIQDASSILKKRTPNSTPSQPKPSNQPSPKLSPQDLPNPQLNASTVHSVPDIQLSSLLNSPPLQFPDSAATNYPILNINQIIITDIAPITIQDPFQFQLSSPSIPNPPDTFNQSNLSSQANPPPVPSLQPDTSLINQNSRTNPIMFSGNTSPTQPNQTLVPNTPSSSTSLTPLGILTLSGSISNPVTSKVFVPF